MKFRVVVMAKCSECGADIPDGWFMCNDCYMWLRGISPGKQHEGEN